MWWPDAGFQQRQLLGSGERCAVKLDHPIERGVHGVKSRRQRLPINNTASHNPKLTKPTDKKRRPRNH
jgi:hypothetical protein